ncbi:MAG: MlaA family lipoprotein [Alphaproteobacteria bacterium]
MDDMMDKKGSALWARNEKHRGWQFAPAAGARAVIFSAAFIFAAQMALGSAFAGHKTSVTKGQAPTEAVSLSASTGFLNRFNPILLLGSTSSEPDVEVIQDTSNNDPLEPINRVVFGFNTLLDDIIVEPTARVYRQFPEEVRTSVSNVFANLRSPITFANDVLQGEWDRAGTTISRMVINTTLGVGGLYDPALEFGYEPHEEDFDQTMALAGIFPGPYLMLPILGPVSSRHAVGLVVDSFAHPLTWVLAGQPLLIQLAPSAAEGLTLREKYLDPVAQIRATSPDYYATVRSLYRQSRMNSINNGRIDPEQQTETHDEIDFDF